MKTTKRLAREDVKFRVEVERYKRECNGTRNYTRINIIYPHCLASDGAMMILTNGGGREGKPETAFWLAEAVFSHLRRTKSHAFQVWKFERMESGEGVLTAHNGDGKQIARQKFKFAELRLSRLTFFFEKGSADGIHSHWLLYLPEEA